MLEREIIIQALEEQEYLNEHSERIKRDIINRLKNHEANTTKNQKNSK